MIIDYIERTKLQISQTATLTWQFSYLDFTYNLKIITSHSRLLRSYGLAFAELFAFAQNK